MSEVNNAQYLPRVTLTTGRATEIHEGKVYSAGKATDRIHINFFGDTKTYDIAIKNLTSEEQSKLKNQTYEQWCEDNPIRKYFWAPLKLSNDQFVLVNINSAIKRLGKNFGETTVELALKDGLSAKNNLLATIGQSKINELNSAIYDGKSNYAEMSTKSAKVLKWVEDTGRTLKDAVHQLSERENRDKDPIDVLYGDKVAHYIKLGKDFQEATRLSQFQEENQLSIDTMKTKILPLSEKIRKELKCNEEDVEKICLAIKERTPEEVDEILEFQKVIKGDFDQTLLIYQFAKEKNLPPEIGKMIVEYREAFCVETLSDAYEGILALKKLLLKEETPSQAIDETMRGRINRIILTVINSVNYRGTGLSRQIHNENIEIIFHRNGVIYPKMISSPHHR